jgi:hypothetical protein
MVHTYGVAPESGIEPTHNDGEASALLGGDATVKRTGRDGHASLTSSVSNLSNTIIGSGTSIVKVQSYIITESVYVRYADIPVG